MSLILDNDSLYWWSIGLWGEGCAPNTVCSDHTKSIYGYSKSSDGLRDFFVPEKELHKDEAEKEVVKNEDSCYNQSFLHAVAVPPRADRGIAERS